MYQDACHAVLAHTVHLWEGKHHQEGAMQDTGANLDLLNLTLLVNCMVMFVPLVIIVRLPFQRPLHVPRVLFSMRPAKDL